jgi:hypothetical protein
MPEPRFRITGVEAVQRSLTPLLHFKLEIRNAPESECIHSILIQAQIQFETPARAYTSSEKERLAEVFGTPDRWGQTLRNKLWAHASTTTGAFTGGTETVLPVPCTYDLSVFSGKYLYGIQEGEIPLLFLFSGSVFYADRQGRLQVQPIPWDQECSFRMPVAEWKGLMERHYPNSAWLMLRRDLFDRLNALKRERGLANWDEVIEELLPRTEKEAVAA